MSKFKLNSNNEVFKTKDFKKCLFSFCLVGTITIAAIPTCLITQKYESKKFFSSPEGIAQCIMCSNDKQFTKDTYIRLKMSSNEVIIDGEELVNALIYYSDSESYNENFCIRQDNKEDTYLIDGKYFSEDDKQVIKKEKYLSGETLSFNSFKTNSYEDLMGYELRVFIDDDANVTSELVKKIK